jgi:hypothetical protein
MKRFLAFVLLAACAPPREAAPPPADDVEFEMALASQLPFDPAALRPGQYVLYVARVEGGPVHTLRWAALPAEGDTLWIENRRPAPPNPRPMVIKSRIDRTGKLLEQWVGEPGGVPARTYPRKDETSPPPGPAPRRDPSSARARTEERPDRITAAGKTYECTLVTSTLTYPDGRTSTLRQWFSKDVPFGASPALGGLVRRAFGRFTMELRAAGEGAVAELEIPAR